MDKHISEQEDEMQVLECLFYHPGEFEKLSNSTFRLNLLPWPEDDYENNVGISLFIQYTDTYPDEAPLWKLEKCNNLSPSQITEIEGKIVDVISTSLGICMVYTIADNLQSWLRDNNSRQISIHEEMMYRLNNSQELLNESDSTLINNSTTNLDESQLNTPQPKVLCDAEERITEEQFVFWAEKFKQEMEKSGIWKESGSERGLTGREMFEMDSSLAMYDNFQINEE